MSHPQRVRNSSYSDKGGILVTPAKVRADDERGGSIRCSTSNYRIGGQSLSSYCNTTFCSTATYQAKPENPNVVCSISNRIDKPASLGWSTFYGVQSPMPATWNEPGSDFDMEVGDVINSTAASPNYSDNWATSSAFRYAGVSGELNGADGEIPSRHGGNDAYAIDQRDCYVARSSRAHGSWTRSSLVDHDTLASMEPLRKGSSSRAPRTNDLTAPLDLDRSVFAVYENDVVQHVPVSEPLLKGKGKGESSLPRCFGQSTMADTRDVRRRKGSSHGSHSYGVRTDDTGAGFTVRDTSVAGTSRCGLSNLVCSSTLDLLPSLSSFALSHFTCFSAADVLPSAVRSATIADPSPSRKAPRALGLATDDREAYMYGHARKQQVNEVNVIRRQETISKRIVQFQDQGWSGGHLEVSRSKHTSSNRQRSSDIVTGDDTPYPIGDQSNYMQDVQSGATKERPRSSSRPPNPFLNGVPGVGARVSEQWLSRRRRFYERYRTLPLSSSLSIDDQHHTLPSFSAPPTRPAPLPPLAIFDRSTASQDRHTVISSSTSPNVPDGSRATGVGLPGPDEGSMPSPTRFTVEGLSEILSALEPVERDEELTYEQVLMLEATLLLGGMGLHDQYRDMRIDIDNMSYEELLALEERIGNVHTGLDEASVTRCVRVENFTASVSCGYVPQEVEVKCSICQVEFEEAEKLGILECGHSYHDGCIKQWLLQKNRCPICKASALT